MKLDSFRHLKEMVEDLSAASARPGAAFLVKRVLKAIEPSSARVVVEYGAGDGAVTGPMLSALGPGARVVAVEADEARVARLRRLSDPRLTCVRGDVRRLGEILGRLGIPSADAVVSGVPVYRFRARAAHELLSRTLDLLRDGGRFVAYQSTTHLIPMLDEYFPEVETFFEVRCLPPRFIFKAVK